MSRLGDVVDGTPRWAVLAAYGTVVSVLPSAVWRTAIGFGADLGMPQAWRDYYQVPGRGTVYVLALSLLSLGAATLTLGLIYRWGEVVPSWVPKIGGQSIPALLVVFAAVLGAGIVTAFAVTSAVNWETISSFRGKPAPEGYALATAAYAPALCWGPLLLLVTFAYWRRRTQSGAGVSVQLRT